MKTFPVKESELVTLAAVTNAVPLARRVTKEVTRHWRLPVDVSEDNETIVSELVTNAVRVTREFHLARGLGEVGRVRFRLRVNLQSLFTEVWDANPILPVRKDVGDFSESGRGLGIVEFMCVRWDSFHAPSGGKFVWTEQRF